MDHGFTKDGLRVDLEYHDQAPGDTMGLEKAIVCHQVDALIDGEVVGYLKISYLDSNLVPTAFPTIWHYARQAGWCFDINDLSSTWYQCHWHAQRIPQSLRGVLPSWLRLQHYMAPDDATMQADLDALEREPIGPRHLTIHEQYEDWSKTILDRPWVDYIRVQELWQRRGVGTLLYEAGARWMATKGFPLWASGTRSDEARATWENMEKEGRLPVTRRDRGDGKVLPVIDYRSGP